MFYVGFEMKHNYLILCCCLFLIFCSSCKKEEDAFGTLSGKITNDFGNGIDKALITLGTKAVHSNFDGSFSFNNVKVGNYTVSISKTHFLPVIQSVEINKNLETFINVRLKAGEPNLKISDSLFEFSSSGGTQKLDIECNAGWVLEHSKNSWYSCSDSVGTGNGTISIICTSNKTSEPRHDSISISSGTLKRKIKISQASELKVESVTGIIGNIALESIDSVLVCFNKPITVLNIINKNEMYSPEIKFRMLNNKSVEFTYGCAELGMEYPFTLQVKDEKGNKFSMDIIAKFYSHKLEFSGSLMHSVLSPDEKNIWLITQNPNKLFHISADSLKIISTTDLDYPPYSISYNMYNDHLYISSNYPTNTFYDNYIYIHNSINGEPIKSIKVINNNPGNWPATYASQICFASNGYGVVLISDSYGGCIWQIINSTDNDSIYKYPYTLHSFMCDRAYLAYDHNRILLRPLFTGTTIGILDATTLHYSTFKPAPITDLVFLAPSKIKDEVFFGHIYDQCIMSLDNQSCSQISYLDCRFDGSADFAYCDGQLLYYCDEFYLRLLDYTNATTLMSCDNIYNLRNFNVTMDGSSAYANTYTKLLKFNTSMFFRNTNKIGVKKQSFFKK